MNRKELIASRIKQARLDAGMSQRELGKLYGCSDVTISEIERGISNIDVASLERLAGILGKPLDWFLSDNVKPQPRPPEAALSELEVSIKAYIPVYGKVSAGAGIEPIDYVAVTRLKPAPETLRAYRVKGLCLEPEVQEGDTVIVDTAVSPQPGNLVVCIIDGQACVKRYREDGKGDKWLENNHGKYQPEDVHLHGVVVEINKKVR